ncbi:MAG: bacterial transferase hexapeptide repeat protein [Frankiales bacterium]|nr:bacterial transferase hexapeptide repeat protein [Frankiales bacterium]
MLREDEPFRQDLWQLRKEARAVVAQFRTRGRLRRENPGMGRIDHRARLEISSDVDVSIGQGSTIDAYALVHVGNDRRGGGVASALHIGRHSAIGELCNVRATGGVIRIGDDVLLGQGVSLVASNHRTDRDHLICELPWSTERTGVTVGHGVWLAANVVVLPGITIGDGAVVGAGSVVTKDVPPMSIVAGVPARVISERQ